MTQHENERYSVTEMRIATATDLSRREVDRAHREEIAAARDQVEQLDEALTDALAWGERGWSLAARNQVAVDEIATLTAERDEARRDTAAMRNRCTLLSEGQRRLTARLADALDAASRPPAATENAEQGNPETVEPPCTHEALEDVGYGSRYCPDCGIHLPPTGGTR